ncbi:hypothetical protein PIB30_057464 [Stylosanthes scabra]|uniref:Uncharacterized protein n=1 Tax=Stylosanthes scabra TaxID=79078 RepID=A0ABU6ZID4_9FABA|nr:hypothetical protein [Stylosanthes scabra]
MVLVDISPTETEKSLVLNDCGLVGSKTSLPRLRKAFTVTPSKTRPHAKSGRVMHAALLGPRSKFSLKCHRGATKFENTEYWTRVVLPRKQKQRFVFN